MAWHGMASDFVFANRLDEATTTLLHSMAPVRLLAATHSMRRKVTGLAVTGSQGRATSSATTRTGARSARNGPSAPSARAGLSVAAGRVAGVPMPTGGGTDKWPSPPPPLLG